MSLFGAVADHYVAAGGLSAYYAAVLADSPWGFWKQLEPSGTTLADASSNARDLTIAGAGSPTLAQTGPDGATADAIAWPNSTTYAVSSQNLLGLTSAAVTLECWAFVPSGGVTAITPLMAATNGSTSTNMVVFFDAAGKLNGRIFNGVSELITSPSALSTGWHHIVHSVGSAGQKIRVDKVTLATGTFDRAGSGVNSPLRLHGHGTYANANGDGAVTIALPAVWQGAAGTTPITDSRTDAHYDALAL